MSETFQVGDIVECINVGPRRIPGFGMTIGAVGLALGGLYTVDAIIWDEKFSESGLVLKEVKAPKPWHEGFFAGRFRKIHRPKADFLTDLLTAPADLRERVES